MLNELFQKLHVHRFCLQENIFAMSVWSWKLSMICWLLQECLDYTANLSAGKLQGFWENYSIVRPQTTFFLLVISEISNRKLFFEIINFLKHQTVRTKRDRRKRKVSSEVICSFHLYHSLFQQKILSGFVNCDGKNWNRDQKWEKPKNSIKNIENKQKKIT